MSVNCRDYVAGLYGFDAVVRRVAPDQWKQASPCEGWTARDVVGHNIFVTHIIEKMVQGWSTIVPAGPDDQRPAAFHPHGYVFDAWFFDPALQLQPDDDPAEVWAARRSAVLAALDEPGATDVEARSPWGHDTVDEFLGLAFYDPLVHSWDLAVSTGQDPFLDPALVDKALALLADPGEGRNLHQPMSLAEPLSGDATGPADRLIALCGRDPAFESLSAVG